MRKSWITEDYTYTDKPGTLSFKQRRDYQSGLLMEIEDQIKVEKSIFDWTQNPNTGEQIGIDEVEFTLDLLTLKQSKHKIGLYTGQTPQTAIISPIWDLNIQLKLILTEYLYAQMRYERSFEGVNIANSKYSDLDYAIVEYVSENLLNRYRFTTIDLYVKPVSLGEGYMKNTPLWKPNIISGLSENDKRKLLVKNLRIEKLSELPDSQSILYIQSEKPNLFTFEYYFDIYFERI